MRDYLMFAKDRNFSVLQLASEPADTFVYISSANAIQQNLITISEVSEAGSVNNLKVTNKSEHYVYFMDGDILVGAKQNRILNTSVLLEPMTEIIIPVSCVEQGRWGYKSKFFSSADYSAPSNMRSSKMKQVDDSLKKQKTHYAKQGEMWNEVDNILYYSKIESGTSSLSDVFIERRKELDDFLRSFESVKAEGANGIAVFIGGKILSIDIFNRKDICSEYYPKIIRGAASEAFYLEPKNTDLDREKAISITERALARMNEGKFSKVSGIGAGIEIRYDEESFAGYELHYKEHLIQKSYLSLR